MENYFWRDYEYGTPSRQCALTDDFYNSMIFLEVLDLLELIEVKPSWSGRPHDHIQIHIDGTDYDETFSLWVERFN